jgi:aminoglycoside 6'-N-acetyltransferase I
MRIVDLQPNDRTAIQQATTLLFESFKEHWPKAWPTLEAARREVEESFGPDRLSRIAVDEHGTVLGWIGGIRQYDGRGIGRALVTDLEEQVRSRGGLTIWLGTDDENQLTSLAGVALWPNPLEHLANIRNLAGHPYEFYQKVGFTIVGVLPDANGPGKPDIFMAKSIRPA